MKESSSVEKKTCFYCKEETQENAHVCPHCRTAVDWIGRLQRHPVLAFIASLLLCGLIANIVPNSKDTGTIQTRDTESSGGPRKEDLLETAPFVAVSFEEIRKEMKSMTNAQFKDYARDLQGKRILWTGYITDVNETFLGNYEVWVDMDQPGKASISDVKFKIPKSIALRLNKGDFIFFRGILT